METNEFELHSRVSDLQKRCALYHAAAVLLSGCVLWFGVDKSPFFFSVLMSLLVAFISLISAIRYTLMCRDRILGGAITYLQSLSFSFRFYFLSGLLLTLAVVAFHYCHENYMAEFYSVFDGMYEEVAKQGQMEFYSPEDMQMVKDLQLGLTPLQRGLNLWFSYMLFGVATALVYSLFIRKSGAQNQPGQRRQQ